MGAMYQNDTGVWTGKGPDSGVVFSAAEGIVTGPVVLTDKAGKAKIKF